MPETPADVGRLTVQVSSPDEKPVAPEGVAPSFTRFVRCSTCNNALTPKGLCRTCKKYMLRSAVDKTAKRSRANSVRNVNRRKKRALAKLTLDQRIEVKVLIKKVLDGIMPDLQEYIERAAETDPARAAELIIKLAEFEVPKLGRLDVKVDKISDVELLAEIERREQELLRAREGTAGFLPEAVDAEFKEE